MKILLKYLFCLLTGILLFSCQKYNTYEKLLQEAQNKLADNKPEIALNLLVSIENPEKMDKESYMKYIVTSVGAKYETKADITKDTLIFEAQRYFNKNEDLEYTVLANYYTAQLYDEISNFPKALESYMFAVNASNRSNNDLLAGKSLNNIGYIYFEQELLESAIVNYQKALLHYDKVENIDQRKLKILTNIGRAYEDYNKLDSAYFYFNKALEKATQVNDDRNISFSLQNLGVVSYGMGQYDKAIDNFRSALAMNVSDESEKNKMYIFLLHSYNKKNDLKSAKKYADLIISALPEVSNTYTVKGMSSALTDYFEQIGDYKKALEYSKLEKATQGKIDKQRDAPALLEADKNFYLGQMDREAQAFRADALFILILAISAFCILLVFFLLVWRRHKKDQAEIQFYGHKYDELRQILYKHTDEYPKIEAEIKSMLEDN
ncbi:tetratricopeptide repeat protein [Dysgonomonas sp. HDW5B]|uniref:tetratricopeptide repeat protein n=1 Tax=Dysgonomonas sp. HDW5B TaxID=2714927 RepID=UPI001408CEBE|nr:tetratricopeptide repeat protein [Dysgonomonas sp. HDW5B]QIK54259.1 tetratricopeptide repeat protein [Dysgonomonas sp. HDW5B]